MSVATKKSKLLKWLSSVEDETTINQLDNFRKGKTVQQEIDIKAEKGAYFTSSEISLNPNSEKKWMLIANGNQSISDIISISEKIKNDSDFIQEVEADIETGTKMLVGLTAASDGIQLTQDTLYNTRHFSNTLFNIMRGGTFDDDYNIEKEDFTNYIAKANKKVLKKKEAILNGLPDLFTLEFILDLAEKDEDKNFKRLCFEYLPLKFSRRHGDPSRPWN